MSYEKSYYFHKLLFLLELQLQSRFFNVSIRDGYV